MQQQSAVDMNQIPAERLHGEIYQRVPAGDAEGVGPAGGWWALRAVGDLVGDIGYRLDGDGALIRRYEEVDLFKPIFAGDYIRFRGRITRIGRSSRDMEFVGERIIRAVSGTPAGDVLDPPEEVIAGKLIIVVPLERQRLSHDEGDATR